MEEWGFCFMTFAIHYDVTTNSYLTQRVLYCFDSYDITSERALWRLLFGACEWMGSRQVPQLDSQWSKDAGCGLGSSLS